MRMVEAYHRYGFEYANVIAHGKCKSARLANEAWLTESNSINELIDAYSA